MRGRGLPLSCWRRPGSRSGTNGRGACILCLGETEFDDCAVHGWNGMRLQSGNFGFDYRMLDRREDCRDGAWVGSAVAGASYTPYDGHAKPLNLLHALHETGTVETRRAVHSQSLRSPRPRWRRTTFRIHAVDGEIGAPPRVVLAAGLGMRG